MGYNMAKFEITIPYPIVQGPYSVEGTKMSLIEYRDWYQMPPELWFTFLIGITQTPHKQSWFRQAAKELIEENFKMT